MITLLVCARRQWLAALIIIWSFWPGASAAQAQDMRFTTIVVTSTSSTAVCVGRAVGASTCTGGLKAGPIEVSTGAFSGAVTLDNDVQLRHKNTGGTARLTVYRASDNKLYLGDNAQASDTVLRGGGADVAVLNSSAATFAVNLAAPKVSGTNAAYGSPSFDTPTDQGYSLFNQHGVIQGWSSYGLSGLWVLHNAIHSGGVGWKNIANEGISALRLGRTEAAVYLNASPGAGGTTFTPTVRALIANGGTTLYASDGSSVKHFFNTAGGDSYITNALYVVTDPGGSQNFRTGTARFGGGTTFDSTLGIGGTVTLENDVQLQHKNSGGTARTTIYRASDNKLYIGDNAQASDTIIRAGGADRITLSSAAPEVAISGSTSVSGRMNSATAQPGFLAFASSLQIFSGAPETVTFDTEVYDGAGNFGSDTFTAPVTGKYLLSFKVSVNGASGTLVFQLVTSNRTYVLEVPTGSALDTTAAITVVADMDASDTAYVRASSFSSLSTKGDATDLYTWFSGRLLG